MAWPQRRRRPAPGSSACALAAALVILLGVIGIVPATAQRYPDRPVKLLVPYGPGGPPDVAARIIGEYLSSHLGAVVVENRPGAGGTIVSKMVATSTPDGYTLMLATSGSLSISAQLYKNAGYDPVSSFAPVALLSTAPLVVAVNSEIPVHSVAELIAYAKANPGKLNYGATIGTPPHMSGEMFKVITGSKIEFVPYKTASQASTDVLGGQIQMTFEGTTGIMPFIRSGKMRPLGVSSPHRLAELPDVPTMVEQGVKGMPPDAWQGIVAPAGTPESIVSKLNRVINDGLTDSGLKTKITQLGGTPQLMTPREFGAFIASQKQDWGKVIAATGVKID
jgi:tripartite-type tricarboxylate transporter receptor subunit TctC